MHMCLILVLLGLAFANAAEKCTTPEGTEGDCDNIHKCKYLQQLVSNGSWQKIKPYECGFDVFAVKVCCPKLSDKIEDRTGHSDVSNHKNINLLPNKICGLADNGDKIVNGQETGLFEFPWMAMLSYKLKTGLEFQCGGTIVNDRYILTAAHCVSNLGTKRQLAGVRVGEHDVRTDVDCETYPNSDEKLCAEPVQDIAIEEVIPHPSFTPSNISNDIALLRLATKINFDPENVKPVCLPTNERLGKETLSKVIVAGWGRTEKQKHSDILMKVTLDFMDKKTCEQKYVSQKLPITEKQLCAFKKGKDSCDGDSGGPLHALVNVGKIPKYVQYGIVSFGPRICAVFDIPAVYTSVYHYMDWILDNLKP